MSLKQQNNIDRSLHTANECASQTLFMSFDSYECIIFQLEDKGEQRNTKH